MKIPPFELERFFAEFEFSVKHPLCTSDCESLSIQELLSLDPDASRSFQEHRLGYTESTGAPTLREAIARLYQDMGPDQILVHAGAQEAIFLFMHATVGPGDHVIVHWPCYQSLLEVPRSLGCEVHLWKAREAHGWSLDLEELKEAIKPNTRAIILNLPHNPTGFLMSREDFLEVNQVAEDRGIFLFSDEVYRESEYTVEDRLPAACDLGPHAVSLGVMSKTYGLPGLRIGWVASRNEGVLNRMAQLKDYTTICSSAPSEFLATHALRHRQALIDRNLGIIQGNLTLLDSFFRKHSHRFQWVRPKAGSIAFPHLLHGDVETLVRELIHGPGVLLAPGRVFGDRENHFRLGFGRRSMPTALAALEEFLNGTS